MKQPLAALLLATCLLVASPDAAPMVDAGPDGASREDVSVRDATEEIDAADSGSDAGPPRELGAPSADVVAAAVSAPLGWFGVNSSGERYCADCEGASIVMAIAAFTGDSSVDARLLEQMRRVIGDNRDPFGNGGYMAQHERMMTGMFAIAKRTPRVWDQLTADEVARIDLVMEATLVGSSHTTSDANAESSPTGIDGDTNLNRGWNPNFREGMVGAMIVSTLYFGGREPTDALLNGYDHTSFIDALDDAGLTHLHDVFAASGGPSASALEAGITDYRYLGSHLGQLPEIFRALTENTYGGTVACGLNDGAGVDVGGGETSGRIESGCDSLPNLGAPGQLLEFDSLDGSGPRSSATYSYDGFRPNLINHLVLLVYDALPRSAETDAAVALARVGTEDLFYKVTQGYRSYANGRDRGVFRLEPDGSGRGIEFMRPLYEEVVAPLYAD